MSVDTSATSVETDVESSVAPMLPWDTTVDARGLAAPQPLINLIEAVNRGHPGDCLEVLTSDKKSRDAIFAWVATAHNQLLAMSPVAGSFRIVVRKTH